MISEREKELLKAYVHGLLTPLYICVKDSKRFIKNMDKFLDKLIEEYAE